MTTRQIEILLIKKYSETYLTVPRTYVVGYEVDMCLLSKKTSYAAEIEIKISKQDLKKDFKKKHTHNSNLYARFYYCVPANLTEYALEVIPKKAGLMEVWETGFIKEVRKPKRNIKARKWSVKDKNKLLMASYYKMLNMICKEEK